MPDPILERDSTLYLLLHIILLILAVMIVIVVIDSYTGGIDFWLGLGIAVIVGFAYPRVAKHLGVAPTHWE